MPRARNSSYHFDKIRKKLENRLGAELAKLKLMGYSLLDERLLEESEQSQWIIDSFESKALNELKALLKVLSEKNIDYNDKNNTFYIISDDVTRKIVVIVGSGKFELLKNCLEIYLKSRKNN